MLPGLVAAAAPRPHFLVILQDDLGHYNVAFNANRTDRPSDDVAKVSSSTSALAAQGIVLNRHYVHWHCSPTRRSLLTGRIPLHHSELLSGITTDDIDLRWTTLGQKLEDTSCSSEALSHVKDLAQALDWVSIQVSKPSRPLQELLALPGFKEFEEIVAKLDALV